MQQFSNQEIAEIRSRIDQIHDLLAKSTAEEQLAVGAAGGAADAGEGTDFHAVANGYVSVTPLQIDLTHYGQVAGIRDWLGK